MIASDVFSRCSGLVASIVVVPLLAADGAPLGGLYLAADEPCCFENIRGTLLVRMRLPFYMRASLRPNVAVAGQVEDRPRRGYQLDRTSTVHASSPPPPRRAWCTRWLSPLSPSIRPWRPPRSATRRG